MIQRDRRGFTLIEVMMAIGIVCVAMLPLLGLMVAGQKTNQISIEEMRAVDLLSAMIEDIRYTPLAKNSSPIFKLSNLPYRDAQLNLHYKVWIDSCWNVFPSDHKLEKYLYQVEWIYTEIPEPGSTAPVEAIFSCKWPPKNSNQVTSDGNLKVRWAGEFTQIVSFPKP